MVLVGSITKKRIQPFLFGYQNWTALRIMKLVFWVYSIYIIYINRIMSYMRYHTLRHINTFIYLHVMCMLVSMECGTIL